jgi:2-keto-4-pentenoate hydratase/2-oxohepta-3-ene-1,7-dioic acid hydratase in catechol pathway
MPRRTLLLIVLLAAGPAEPAAPAVLDACLSEQGLPRVARVVGPDGRPRWVRVVAHEDGLPTAVLPIAGPDADLADALRAAEAPDDGAPVWRWTSSAARAHVCSPVPLSQADLDAERRVIVAAGLNYRAHADEAGGGDVFLFPKPAAPTAPYGEVAPPAGVTLLDYEVELGFVLLEDVALSEPPSLSALLARSAFFVANDVSDREPIILEKAPRGPGTGFVRGKGQDGFLPAGPWLVRGTDLFAALEACGADGLGLFLEVDEGDGFRSRQASTTALWLLDPADLVARIAEQVATHGLRTDMPMERGGRTRLYPFAVEGPEGPTLPAGSVVLTGTPEGVALRAPSPVGVVLRGLLRLRGPFAQAAHEERERAAAGGPGGYLEAGDRVRARIDGLGSQIIRIGAVGATPAADPCAQETSP